MTTYDLTQGVPANIKTGDVLNCPYSGASIGINLKKGAYKLEVWGAKGGDAYSTTYPGANGGYSVGTLTLNGPKDVFLYAGGTPDTHSTSAVIAGGFNGGGNSGSFNGGAGGGGSDIRIGQDSIYARVIVAGGGGGGCYYSPSYKGGVGGGAAGGDSTGYSTTYTAKGGSQTEGGRAGGYSTLGTVGSFGAGGACASTVTNYNRSGGGGGGWYGGGGGGYRSSKSYYYRGCSGGGGGSGYVYDSVNAGNYPEGCLLDSSMYLTDASTLDGTTAITSPDGVAETGHASSGYVRITVIQVGYDAVWQVDGSTIRTDTVQSGYGLPTPPNVDRTGYTTVWQVDGTTIDPDTYIMPERDIVIVAVYIANVYTLTYYDSGVVSYGECAFDSTIDIPIGNNGTGKFVGWWDGSTLYPSTYTHTVPYGVLLIARYDLTGTKVTLDSVSLQPNPVQASATVLLAVTAVITESSVPRWSGVTFSASDGLPMSSPYQVGIWDTSEGDPMAVFAGKGIKSSGRDVPPLQAQTVPLPRCGIWSSGISDASGGISFQITGTVTGGPYTSTIVMLSESAVNVTSATIRYDGGTAINGQCNGSKVEFPKGTYSTFTITITGLSMPYEHVHILNIAPGGSE